MPQLLVLLSSIFWSGIEEALTQPILKPGETLAHVNPYLAAACAKGNTLRVEDATPDRWNDTSRQLRTRVLEEVVFRGGASEWKDLPTKVEWLDDDLGGPGYRIRKLRFQTIPGLWIPALLYEPVGLIGPVPAVLNVNGHDPKGKRAPYKQEICINQVKRGMIALNVEWIGFGQLNAPGYRHDRMNKLDLCGTSGLAVFYLAMRGGLDILAQHPQVDGQRIAMTGLSGGGWQTIILSSLDTRISFANPVAGYSMLSTRAMTAADLGDSEQMPPMLGRVADYGDLTALLAPRSILLTYCQKDDCCFQAPSALPPLEAHARPFFAKLGAADKLTTHVNFDPGTHNYLKDNREAFYRGIGDAFFPGDPSFPREDFNVEAEIRTAEELAVELPANNATFDTLANDLVPDSEMQAASSHLSSASLYQDRLAQVLRNRSMTATADEAPFEEVDGLRVRRGRLTLREMDASLPFTEIVPESPTGTVLFISDHGRMSAIDWWNRARVERKRFIAVDLLNTGETSLGHLIPLLFECVGEPLLGVQVSQLAAILSWAKTDLAGKPITLIAIGPRMTTAALVATILRGEADATLILNRPLRSFRDLIWANEGVNQGPELFCHGLYRWLDIVHLVAVASEYSPIIVESAIVTGFSAPGATSELDLRKEWVLPGKTAGSYVTLLDWAGENGRKILIKDAKQGTP